MKDVGEAIKQISLDEFNNGNTLGSEFDYGFIRGVEFASRELSREAADFCIWINRQCWCANGNDMWFNFANVIDGDETEYTTEQLFEKFKELNLNP